jgi:23S rRNA (cytosine1962-C5)-methyltransferase
MEEIVRIAAAERGMRLRVRGVSIQAEDHPWIVQMPMTRYLMSWLVQHDG